VTTVDDRNARHTEAMDEPTWDVADRERDFKAQRGIDF